MIYPRIKRYFYNHLPTMWAADIVVFRTYNPSSNYGFSMFLSESNEYIGVWYNDGTMYLGLTNKFYDIT